MSAAEFAAAVGRPERPSFFASKHRSDPRVIAFNEWVLTHGKEEEAYRDMLVAEEAEQQRKDREELARRNEAEKWTPNPSLDRMGVQPRDIQALHGPAKTEALEAAIAWWDSKKSWLVLSGGVGTGKTIAACWLLNRASRDWQWDEVRRGLFVRATELVRPAMTPQAQDKLEKCYRVNVLAIDDLGVESLSEFGLAQLLDLLTHRHSAMLRTVITTNLTVDELKTRLGLRIIDRIKQDGEVVVLTGKSLRSPRADSPSTEKEQTDAGH